MSAAPRRKPTLRGWSHQLAAIVAAPAAVALWAGAHGLPARTAAAVYGATLVVLFAISAIYHRPTWSPRVRDLIGRADHSAIFLLIAGTSTPFCLRVASTGGSTLLAVVWAGALCGVVLAVAWPGAPKPLMAAIYVLLGWTFAPFVPALLRSTGPAVLGLIVGGALVYTAGAAVYALKRPDPSPLVFGYDEVFHLLVVAAATLHFAAISLTLPLLN